MTCDRIIPPADHAWLSPCAEPGWLLCEDGLSPAREREIEALFAIGNGYLGVRASIGGVRFSNPATFLDGIFVGAASHISGRTAARRQRRASSGEYFFPGEDGPFT